MATSNLRPRPPAPTDDYDYDEDFDTHLAMLLLVALGAGAALAAVAIRSFAPGLAASLLGPAPKAYWYLARASGLVAYVLLWASMLFGLQITTKTGRLWLGGPNVYDFHQFTSLLGLAFIMFHVGILLGDQFIGYSVTQLLVPFAGTPYRPLWTGLGQVGLYVGLAVTITFYLRRWIGQRTWRLIHYTSFAMFALVLAHGLGAGTDAGNMWVQALYWLTGATVLFATFYRIVLTRVAPRRPARPLGATPGTLHRPGGKHATGQQGARTRPVSRAA